MYTPLAGEAVIVDNMVVSVDVEGPASVDKIVVVVVVVDGEDSGLEETTTPNSKY